MTMTLKKVAATATLFPLPSPTVILPTVFHQLYLLEEEKRRKIPVVVLSLALAFPIHNKQFDWW
jgi:hypothetical protein